MQQAFGTFKSGLGWFLEPLDLQACFVRGDVQGEERLAQFQTRDFGQLTFSPVQVLALSPQPDRDARTETPGTSCALLSTGAADFLNGQRIDARRGS